MEVTSFIKRWKENVTLLTYNCTINGVEWEWNVSKNLFLFNLAIPSIIEPSMCIGFPGNIQGVNWEVVQGEDCRGFKV